MCKELFATIFGIMMIATSVLFVSTSGVAYGYFNNSIFFENFDINLKVMYGCGIGVGIVLFAATFAYFKNPTFCGNYVFTIPLYITMLSLYIAYSQPSQSSRYEQLLDQKWNENSSTLIDLQIRLKCCGWDNATDRGIAGCPFEFESGCSAFFFDYLEPRNQNIFVTSIVMFAFLFVSVIFFIVFSCLEDEENMYEYIFPFNEII
ncbi:hypothetical protein GPJ56_004544 [Histomonas meleagridis]|uniref:uncharacterized protein n=1 Tax=Histomonas meleagridis TaxID=135588 RepID=UPI0035599569|nr:hypothetical protein GPJ56_004544 [Histomonas meleagridis]KAH0797363.1 hypothetical protein GO595_009866 [Histomonas meleagridis]